MKIPQQCYPNRVKVKARKFGWITSNLMLTLLYRCTWLTVGVINPDAPYKVAAEGHADEISWYVNITKEGLIHALETEVVTT